MRKSLLAVVIGGILLIAYVATGALAPVGPEMFVVIGIMLLPFIVLGGIVYGLITWLRS